MPSLEDVPLEQGAVKRRDVDAFLTYTIPPEAGGENPKQVVPGFLDDPGTTVKLTHGPLERINDVRGFENHFTLEQNGFCFKKHTTNFTEWDSRKLIEDIYCNQEMVQFISDVFGGKEGGVDEVIIFHQGRRGPGSLGKEAQDGERTNPFAKQVHLDMPESTIVAKIRSSTDIKATWALQGRIRQVNVWRPLFHPVYDCGLCVADMQSMNENDMIEIDRVKPDGTFFDTMGGVRYRSGYRWWYMSHQTPDDVLLFMGYDSACARKEKPGIGYTFHSAFDIPDPPPMAPTRESIELRALVLTWPKAQLVIEPPLPGRLSATTPSQTIDDELEHVDIPASRPMRFVDLDDPFAASPPASSNAENELYLVRQSGHIQVVDLHRFPAHYPRHPLHDSIMSRVLVAEPDHAALSTAHDPLDLNPPAEQDVDEVDIVAMSYRQRLAVADLQKREMEQRLRVLEAQLADARLQNAVLAKRLSEPDLML